jgi:hypothetical protein
MPFHCTTLHAIYSCPSNAHFGVLLRQIAMHTVCTGDKQIWRVVGRVRRTRRPGRPCRWTPRRGVSITSNDTRVFWVIFRIATHVLLLSLRVG